MENISKSYEIAVPDALIAELIEHSAEEVVKKLSKKKQDSIAKSFISSRVFLF